MKPKRIANPQMISLLDELVTSDGFNSSCLPDVTLMRSTQTIPRAPVSYNPSIIIIAQGRKRGYLGARSFVYDPGNYLVLSVPLPFECQTIGTPEEPMLGVAVRVNASTITELLLEQNGEPAASSGPPDAVHSCRLTEEIADAAVRLLKCMRSPAEARILGPQIIREITYRALCGEQGGGLRALATPQSNFSQVSRALRRIHIDFAQPLDVGALAREAGMSVSTFHANFKSVTSHPPQRYLQTIRLHKAQVLLIEGVPVAEAASRVGYESASQFSREFKRLFGGSPREIANRDRIALSMS